MPGIPSLGGDDDIFDEKGVFVAGHVPDPGSFLTGERVLTDDDHCRVHAIAREVFEARGVYDVTFGYNLAKLNRDTRHESAGFRYAEETAPREGPGADLDADDLSVLRAEFTPTTEFCPQGDSLAIGAFRAFNLEGDTHGHDLVRVRVDEMHQDSRTLNMKLSFIETEYVDSGTVPGAVGDSPDSEVPNERGMGAPF